MSVGVPAAILPARTSASSSGRGNSAISNAAPASISFCNTDVRAKRTSTFAALTASNSGTASVRSERIAPPLRSLMVADIAKLPGFGARARLTRKGPPT